MFISCVHALVETGSGISFPRGTNRPRGLGLGAIERLNLGVRAAGECSYCPPLAPLPAGNVEWRNPHRQNFLSRICRMMVWLRVGRDEAERCRGGGRASLPSALLAVGANGVANMPHDFWAVLRSTLHAIGGS
jgi:hypothetical protein